MSRRRDTRALPFVRIAPAEPFADAAEDAAAGGATGESRAPLRLDYATPMGRRWKPVNAALWLGVRKVVFASGVAMLVWGCVSAAAGVDRHNAPIVAAWGAGLAALMVPFPFRRPTIDRIGPCRCGASGENSGI